MRPILLGPRVPAETLGRFWTMLAHGQATKGFRNGVPDLGVREAVVIYSGEEDFPLAPGTLALGPPRCGSGGLPGGRGDAGREGRISEG